MQPQLRSQVLLIARAADSEPFRGWSDLDAAYGYAAVARSAGGIFDFYLDTITLAGYNLRDYRQLEFTGNAVELAPCVQISCNAPVGGGVNAVGGDFVLDYSFGPEVQIILGGSAGYGLRGQHHDALMAGADSELVLGADHAE